MLNRIVVEVNGTPQAAAAPFDAKRESAAMASERRPLVVLLHGFSGAAEDLAPFARSLGIAGRFVFPSGLVDLAPLGRGGRAWWPVDVDARERALENGPRDLSEWAPQGIDVARAELSALLDELTAACPEAPIVIGGFSQGAMLACDLALRTPREIAGLVLLSGARITAEAWRPLYARRAGLPVFMSHGRSDADLSFAAAEAFMTDLVAARLHVDWCPFDGAHEIPLLALRRLRGFLRRVEHPDTRCRSR